jgi:hypothetical protein
VNAYAAHECEEAYGGSAAEKVFDENGVVDTF